MPPSSWIVLWNKVNREIGLRSFSGIHWTRARGWYCSWFPRLTVYNEAAALLCTPSICLTCILTNAFLVSCNCGCLREEAFKLQSRHVPRLGLLMLLFVLFLKFLFSRASDASLCPFFKVFVFGKQRDKHPCSASAIIILSMVSIIGSLLSTFQATATRSFSLSRNKKLNWKPSSGRSQENEIYIRLIYKQFVQVWGLCGPQFLSYLPKRFTHLCRALYGAAIFVHRFGAPIWPPEINKNIWRSLFL